MFRTLFPPNFFRLLHRQSQATREEMVALVEFIKTPTPTTGAVVLRFENETARRHAKLIRELRRTSEIPIDRVDVERLSQTMFEMAGRGKNIVDELTAYTINPNEILNRMAGAACEAAVSLNDALGGILEDHDRTLKFLTRARARADFVESCYREGLEVLFKTENVVAQLAYREIYRHFSGIAEQAMAAANIVGDILVESF